MIDFKHSDVGSIRCPYHNRREVFTANAYPQPLDTSLVRYPCGYVDGLPSASPSTLPASPEPVQDQLLKELSNRVRSLEERGFPRRTPTVPSPKTPVQKGGVALP